MHSIESTQSVIQKPMRTISMIRWVFSIYIGRSHAGQGSRGPDLLPPENHKNIEYLSNTGPDPLKFSKLPSQHSTLGHHRHPSETPFKWRFAGGPMMARFCDIWILSPLKKRKRKKRCQSCRVGSPLTKLSGSAHGSSSEAVVT